MTTTKARRVVLLAEDNANDELLMRMAFDDVGVSHSLFAVGDGKSALAYLSGEGRFNDREKHPVPALIIADLKMPVLDGFALLGELQSTPELDQIPVVVLSSSLHDDDIKRAKDLGANDYLVKPMTYAQLVEIVRSLHARWLSDR